MRRPERPGDSSTTGIEKDSINGEVRNNQDTEC